MFVNLICGMLSPSEGEIRIGGEKMSGKKRGNVSAIFQDFACYDASLRYNVATAQNTTIMNDNEIRELLKKIDFASESDINLDEEIGIFSEDRMNLSGGQWQKIALARAVYASEADILILDEPTSAMDPISETNLYSNFIDLTGDKTTLIISHRLGIGRVVDRILVFKDGMIVEDGNHEELISRNGEYARLFKTQMEWYS